MWINCGHFLFMCFWLLMPDGVFKKWPTFGNIYFGMAKVPLCFKKDHKDYIEKLQSNICRVQLFEYNNHNNVFEAIIFFSISNIWLYSSLLLLGITFQLAPLLRLPTSGVEKSNLKIEKKVSCHFYFTFF